MGVCDIVISAEKKLLVEMIHDFCIIRAFFLKENAFIIVHLLVNLFRSSSQNNEFPI